MDTLGLSDREKLDYCENYAQLKTQKAKDSREINDKKLLTKDLEKKMTRHQIMSLRCFAMRQSWRIPKESPEFANYMRFSKSSILESTDPLQDFSAEIIIPFEHQYPSALHALVTLVRWKYGLLSFFKIKYVARKLHIDLPSDEEDFSINNHTSGRGLPTSLTASAISFELQKRDPLLQVPDSASIDSHRPSLKMALTIREVGWSVVCLRNVDKLPKFSDNEPVGIVYMVRSNSVIKSVVVLCSYARN
jgi:hypothetical protein